MRYSHVFCSGLLAPIISLSVLAQNTTFTAIVVGVGDGDTITVLRGDVPIRIRLWGIDCPESGQAFGKTAKQFTADLAYGKVVTVRVRDVDRYGRQVADIILPDGKNLNHEIVKAGFAWWFRRYAPQEETMARLEIHVSPLWKIICPKNSRRPCPCGYTARRLVKLPTLTPSSSGPDCGIESLQQGVWTGLPVNGRGRRWCGRL